MYAVYVLVAVLFGVVQGKSSDFRLPTSVVPTRYKINLETHFDDDNFTFYGEVWIDVNVKEATDSIKLHSKDLDINENKTSLESLPPDMEDGEEIDVLASTFGVEVRTSVDRSKDIMTLHLARELEPGLKYRLHFEYTGKLSKTLSGYYRVSYIEKKTNITRWMAATTFEPTEARRTFPCFDEPSLKARFQINLARPKNSSSLSNMPLRSTAEIKDKPEWVWDQYVPSPPMSTYLVAFFVGNLSSKERNLGVPFKIWSRKEVSQQTEFALKYGPEMLNFLSNYTTVDNPLPKQDILALPSFISDALENWGLISFGERYLLFKPGVSSATSVHKIANILAHELAHNWFGNLVTISWWSDIWLNEGFATYFGALAVDNVIPQWDFHQLHAVNAFLKIFSIDAFQTSHPLTFETSDNEDLFGIFDTTTYLKGFYLLRMLNFTLGEPTFRNACGRYIRTYQYKNVNQKDLWSSFTTRAHEEGALPKNILLKDVMKSWTTKPGYPLVTVQRNYETNTAIITQTRFLRPQGDLESRTTEDNTTRWWIPLSYTTEDEMDFTNTTPKIFFEENLESITITNLSNNDKWIIFNLHASGLLKKWPKGLYRVNYDLENWDLINKFLNSDRYEEIPVLNRALLLDDVLDFARAGLVDYSLALNVTNYLKKERHYLPWKAGLSNLGYISRMIRSTDHSKKFKTFLSRLVGPRLGELGFEPRRDDTLMDTLHRQQILHWTCHTGHRSCVSKAVDLFKKWMQTPNPEEKNPIPEHMRSIVYCTGIEYGSEKEWNFLWRRYLNSSFGPEKSTIIRGLGCSRQSEILNRFLKWSTQINSGVRKEDSVTIFRSVARNDVGYDLARTFLHKNVNQILEYVGQNPFHLPALVEALSTRMNKEEHLKQLEDFQSHHVNNLRTANRTVKQAQEKVKFNIAWLDNNYNVIARWLDSVSVPS